MISVRIVQAERMGVEVMGVLADLCVFTDPGRAGVWPSDCRILLSCCLTC